MKTLECGDQSLLQSIKRLCTETNCFRKAEPNDRALDFYKRTMKSVDKELESFPNCDKEDVSAIVANSLIILSSSAACHAKAVPKFREKIQVTLDENDVDCDAACRFLDESASITVRHNNLVQWEEHMYQWSSKWRASRFRKIALWGVVIVLICLLAFAVSGWFVPQTQPVSETILQKAEHWYKYDLRKEALPVSFTEKWIIASSIGRQILACLLVSGILLGAAALIARRIFRRKAEFIRRRWMDYRRLCETFDEAAKEMDELEW